MPPAAPKTSPTATPARATPGATRRGAASRTAPPVGALPPLQSYGRSRTDSGVRAYAALPGAIILEFANGSVYLYTDASTGAACIARMQRLARSGRGLSTFVSRVVRNRYAARLRQR